MAEDDWQIPKGWVYLTSQIDSNQPGYTDEEVYRDENGGIWFICMNIETGALLPRSGSRHDRRRYKSMKPPIPLEAA